MGERLGSGDGERKTLLTRQIAFEPLPASVLLGHLLVLGDIPVGCQRAGVSPSSSEVAVCVKVARAIDEYRVLDREAATPKEEDPLVPLRLRNVICKPRNDRRHGSGLHGTHSGLILCKS